ncbi:CBS domain-containing protein [Roseospira navarrensis]|uniref:CBS domain-containing protein n=2 Tax=Roseospira navarrensis TaxID=140058 RepID=A0A7X1ZG72_9PROT|nr:CBS domain-containing protein [Roseospira navarrensis]
MGPRVLANNAVVITSLLALCVGVMTGGGIILFREGIAAMHQVTYGSDVHWLASTAEALPWWALLWPPVVGGLVVGVWHHWTMPTGRTETVSHVIEASVLRGGRMPLGRGLACIVGAMLSLGCGASVGREGPAVHLGATLGAWLAQISRFGRGASRTLLGCGAAAAVAASFNAPIAGALFAHEVVVGHYAAQAFVPVVIASLTGTVVSRLWFGTAPAFSLPDDLTLVSFLEFPAFALLGVICGLLAAAFMVSLIVTDLTARRSGVPGWLRPALAGLVLGVIALEFPEVLGVGYEITNRALSGDLVLDAAVAIAAAKIVATVICLGWGFGGGVFSPSLAIGGIVGCAFGIAATALGPVGLSSGHGAYAVVGMGAVAAAVLGAPISTCLIIFELTANYALTVAVMMAVVVATTLSRGLTGHTSLFHWQLARRGLDLDTDRRSQLLREKRVRDLARADPPTVAPDAPPWAVAAAFRDHGGEKLFVVDGAGVLLGTIALTEAMAVLMDDEARTRRTALDVALSRPPVLAQAETLEEALALMDSVQEAQVAVVRDRSSMVLVGVVHERDLLRAYAEALGRLRAEERGDPDRV